MSRAPEQLAPSWLPRQQRRRINRQLHRLLRRDVCSVCGSLFKHNSRTTSGLDTQGSVVVAGECCTSRVAVVFGWGLYSDRHYDFLLRRSSQPNIKATNEQIADAIVAYQKAIAETDKRLDDVERRGGGGRARNVSLLDHPWKSDDRDWFEQNQERSHRARTPFPGEVDKEVAETPAGQALIMLVRQVEPGSRRRAVVFLDANFLPLPDDEAVAHALFEVAVRREAVPPDRQALCALMKKYTVHGSQGDA
jgi:hypothetical protein